MSDLSLWAWKKQAESSLIQAGVETSEARLEVRIIVEHTLQLSQSAQVLHRDQPLSGLERSQLEPLINRRQQREPLSHLLGEWEFWGLPIKVSPETLTPRPDTEVLVEEALGWFKSLPTQKRRNATIIDVGTGSGCIGMALASELSECRYVLLDLSSSALEVAQAGWRSLVESGHLSSNIEVQWVQADLLEEKIMPLGSHGTAPILIVSNPPYIKRIDQSSLMPEVKNFDPPLALFDERTDGLGITERLIAQAAQRLDSGGALFVEVGFDQTSQTESLFIQYGFTLTKIRYDYGGNPRVVWGVKP